MTDLYKPELIDYQFYKPSSDDFEDNFFGAMVEVTAYYDNTADEYLIGVFGTNEFGMFLGTTDVEVQDEVLFNIMKLDVVTIEALKGLGFEYTAGFENEDEFYTDESYSPQFTQEYHKDFDNEPS